jgi:hypothetical protein
LPSEKFKGIWPLPGGTTEYVTTLAKILKRIQENNPTYDELLKWFVTEFKLKGGKTPASCLEYLRRFGFFSRSDDRLSLTDESIRFLASRDYRIVYKVLSDRILGLDDIISWVSKEPLSEDEIHKRLREKYDLNWRTSAQTYFRLAWLRSLKYVEVKGGRYTLTDEGLRSLSAKGIETPPVPVTTGISTVSVIPEPLKKYISHATALIKKNVAMSEANTISILIEPFLEALGWNIRDFEEVQREYSVHVGEKIEYVDIALKINNKPVIFIEAKPIGTDLRDHLAEQPINYAHTERVDWCILTNGREWKVYNAFWRIKGIEGKMFLKLSLDEFEKNIEKIQLLSKESMISGKLEEEAELEHAKRISLEWLKQKENSIVKEIIQSDPSLKEEYVRRILRGMTSD